MSSVFTKIINNKISCFKVAENNDFIAFLDINPICKGHTLVVPKKEVDYIFDINNQDYAELWLFAKKVSKAIKTQFICEKIGVSVVGLEVAHAHIHLIPINSVSDMNFNRERLLLSNDELLSISKKIHLAFNKI